MKICIVQGGPVYNKLHKSLEKAFDYISDAKANNSDLIVFGESWLSGYPIWLDVCEDVNIWDHAPIKQVWATMYENSIALNSTEMEQLRAQVKDASMYTVIGANEKIGQGKGNRSLYNSVFSFDPKGRICNHHRKLMPTFTEKLVHTQGDGHGLNSFETPFGRVGSLICWEHWMPMARQVMHDAHEDLHLALWPCVKEKNQLASQHYAIEGRCHVVAVGQLMHRSELDSKLSLSEKADIHENGMLLNGGSSVYAPDGSCVLEAQYNSNELLYCELDLGTNLPENMNLSVSGHYQRFDIFEYDLNKKRITD